MKKIIDIITKSLLDLENQDKIVIIQSDVNSISEFIFKKIEHIAINDNISDRELRGLRSLILKAIDDKRFFDWETPILIGLSYEELDNLAKKLPNE